MWKFEREECPTVMDGLVIRFTLDAGWSNHPEISTSRNGVCISGAWPTLDSQQEIESVKAQLDSAFKIFQELKNQKRKTP